MPLWQNKTIDNLSKVHIEIIFSSIAATDFNGYGASCLPDTST